MTIATKTEPTPVTEAALTTRNRARLFAVRSPHCPTVFQVSTAETRSQHNDMEHGPGGHWNFDVQACEEAIEFFTLLRDQLRQL